MKLAPNCITLSRIGLSLLLLYLVPLGTGFSVVYLLCGITDLLDGPIARMTGTVSNLGAKLDSVADMTLAGTALYTLYPFLGLTLGLILWVVLIAVIRGASILTALRKFRTYGSIHTYGNKLAGILLFLTPLLLPYVNQAIWTIVVCLVATLSAIEELILLLISSELQLDRKGLYVRR
ncbi:CDP-alcohol phosphatidyltransferase family protein [Paenibacillus sp. FSL R7-0333]|uniref:CDP-alcohol phosphatidyltransferase family protein n=1 Tax=Paenibacillus sp. FSL R7-0333 TaxID=1926587 RepID=UPI00096CA09D|nr:phosphatidylglycerophosphate synthase [Paenibacillus sp. FSL R7-0333]